MIEKLKPCPFCGGAGKYGTTVDHDYFIWCETCGASVGYENTRRLLAKRWNKRIDSNLEDNVNKVIDLLTESRDVLGLVVGEQKEEISRLKAEIQRLKSDSPDHG